MENKAKGKIIAFGNVKGGTGKTSVLVNIAATLAKRNFKVLIIDSDQQANTTNYMQLDETAAGYKSLVDIYRNRRINPSEVVAHTKIFNIDIIGGSIYLIKVEKEFSNISLAELQLKKYLERNKEFFKQYDYILIDTNPCMSTTNQNSFLAADKIICVAEVGISSFKGVELFDWLLTELADATDIPIKIDAIVVNRYKSVTNLSKDYIGFLKDNPLTKNLIMNTLIYDTVKIPNAELNQVPVTISEPNSKPSKSFNELVDELISKGVL